MNSQGKRSVTLQFDSRRRSHELRSDRIDDHFIDHAGNLFAFLTAEVPSHHFADWVELVRATSPPERRCDSGLIQNPSEREVDDAPAVVLASESIQAFDGLQVPAVSGLLEFGISATQSVAAKN